MGLYTSVANLWEALLCRENTHSEFNVATNGVMFEEIN